MRRFTLFLALMIFIGTQVAQAQTRTLSGTVTNAEDGSTIPGVSVVVKGTTIGTTTDLQGRYSLLVTADSRILQFSFVGMKAVEVPIGVEDVINVTMQPEVTAIEGVVVTAIGVKRETKALGYSVQAVGGEDIARSGNTNVVNSLAARAAGVSVTSSSGAAGSSSFMTIRGISSMTGNNQPLFVIDGIPIDNSELASTTRTAGVALSNRAIDINPEDIETMSILKGGAATALYGIRAANGAVIITTKKGAATPGKRMDVSFNSSVRFEQVSQLPSLQSKYAQGSGGTLNLGGTTASYGPLISDLRLDVNNPTPYYPQGLPVLSDDASLPQMSAYDNYESFFQTGITYDNSLSVSGGSNDATYYFSIADLRSEGIIPNNTFNRTSIALAGDAKISNSLKTSGRMSYINSGGTRIQQGSNTSGVMLALTRMPVSFDIAGGVDDPNDNTASYMLPSGAQRNAYNGGGYDNPFWTGNKNPFEDKVNRFIGSIQFDLAATDWLDFTYRFGTDVYTDRRKQIIAIGSRTSPTGQVFEDHYFRQDLNSDLFATARFNLTDDLKGSFLLGNNLFQSDYQNLYNSIGGLVVPDFYNLSNAASVFGFEYNSRKRTMAFYADLGLDYKSMLYLNVTMRREQSTTLPEANNTFNYPSVSGSFVFTELPGLQDNSILSFGKVRASYALIGNDAPVFFTIPTYSSANAGDGWTTTGIQFPNYGTAGYMVANVLANPDLKPETAKNFEVGFDLRFLQNRIGFDFTYFDMKNEDLILSVPIAKSSGYYNANLNAASMTNKGIEIVLKTTPVMNNDFKWDLDFNFTKIENNVTGLADGVSSVFLGGFVGKQVRAVVGNPYGSIFGTDFQRNDAGQLIINDDPNSPEYGYPMMDPEDKNIGNVLPDWTLGIFNSLSYKDFRLDFLLDIKTGGKMWNGTRGANINFGMAKETEARGSEIVFDGVKESDGSANDITAVLNQAWYTGNGGGFFGPGAPYVDDTDWVRLRELTFSYMLPRQTMNDWGLESAELYFTGRNLWLSTPYDGVDPETSLYGSDNAQGLDYYNMPGVKSYMIGLRINL